MGWSKAFKESLSGNVIIKNILTAQVFHAEAMAGPSGVGRFNLIKDETNATVEDCVRKLSNSDHDIKAARFILFNKDILTINEIIVMLINEEGTFADFDLADGIGLYFENRNTGMWWALYKMNSDLWAWWEGEVQSFDLEEVHYFQRQQAIDMWRHMTGPGLYKQASVFKKPEDIEKIVQGL